MLMKARGHRGTLLTTLSTRAYGLVFLVVLGALLSLSVLAYQQKFTPVVLVDLRTDTIGNQLQQASDVKIRGLVVGSVRRVDTSGHGATIQLALDPDQAGSIPANVSARLLPKTLFGERFVDLQLPADPGRPIRAGDVIPQDRSSSAIELERVFDDLLPLLRTVKPAELATTLNALATALDGRGAALGQNLVQVNRYLGAFNPNLPALQQDISGLADVASIYADAAPDLLNALEHLSTTSTTLQQKQSALAGFLAGTAGFARTATSVLDDDGDRLIRVGEVSRPTLGLLQRYAPMYACFTEGLSAWKPRIRQAFGADSLHITLEVVPQRAAYVPGEEPAWRDDRAPSCKGLPSAGGSQAHPYDGTAFDDGTIHARDRSSSLVPPSGTDAGDATPSAFVQPSRAATRSGYTAPDSGDAGTAAEQRVTAALFSSQLGLAPQQVPSVADLLLGPMVRGTQVSER